MRWKKSLRSKYSLIGRREDNEKDEGKDDRANNNDKGDDNEEKRNKKKMVTKARRLKRWNHTDNRGLP